MGRHGRKRERARICGGERNKGQIPKSLKGDSYLTNTKPIMYILEITCKYFILLTTNAINSLKNLKTQHEETV